MIANMILSDKAARLFRFCAWWVILECVILGSLFLFPAEIPARHSVPGVLACLLISMVGTFGTMATLLLFVGAMLHLMKFSGFSRLFKIVWGTRGRYLYPHLKIEMRGTRRVFRLGR